MCAAGRIRHHLRHNLHRRDSTILFVGFQAAGSLGRVILDGAQRVRLSGEDINVRAQIRRIDSYSAHADQSELLAWIRERRPISGTLFLDHGEPEAVAELAQLAGAEDKGQSLVMAEIGERYVLSAGKPAKRTRTCKPGVGHMCGSDWQNDFADFSLGLKRDLNRIRDAEARRHAIADMRKVLDSYAEFRDAKKARNEGG